MLHKWNWKVLTTGIDWTPLWRCVNARSSSKRKREFTITAYLWYLLQSCHLHASHMLSMLSIKTLTNAFNLHLRIKRIEHLISKQMGCEHVSILVIQIVHVSLLFLAWKPWGHMQEWVSSSLSTQRALGPHAYHRFCTIVEFPSTR